ncbi:proline-rich antigen [Pyronema omphalodes]|nr:proline-rich antigen [Pyronema omphalodes]
MKFSVAIILAAVSAIVSAQGLGDLPPCAALCASGALGGMTQCSTTDFKCICSQKDFLTKITECVSKSCDKADQDKTVQFAAGLCKSANAPIDQTIIDSLTKASSSVASAAPTGSSSSAAVASSAVPTASGSPAASDAATGSAVPSALPTGAANKLAVSGMGAVAGAAALFLL